MATAVRVTVLVVGVLVMTVRVVGVLVMAVLVVGVLVIIVLAALGVVLVMTVLVLFGVMTDVEKLRCVLMGEVMPEKFRGMAVRNPGLIAIVLGAKLKVG